jgi:hypothetical protein
MLNASLFSTRKRTMPNSSKRRGPARTAAAASNSRNAASPRRGRPPKKVFINVEIKATTRDNLNLLKRKSGLRNQGEVLDFLILNQLRKMGVRTVAK